MLRQKTNGRMKKSISYLSVVLERPFTNEKKVLGREAKIAQQEDKKKSAYFERQFLNFLKNTITNRKTSAAMHQ